MQELPNPWLRWFTERPATLQLVQEFQAAHGSETTPEPASTIGTGPRR
jgi:hypothetical protein